MVLTPHFLYESLDTDGTRRCVTYRSLFSVETDPVEIQAIPTATETGTLLGNGRFKKNIETTLKCRIEPLSHGGDRKSEVFRDHYKRISD